MLWEIQTDAQETSADVVTSGGIGEVLYHCIAGGGIILIWAVHSSGEVLFQGTVAAFVHSRPRSFLLPFGETVETLSSCFGVIEAHRDRHSTNHSLHENALSDLLSLKVKETFWRANTPSDCESKERQLVQNIVRHVSIHALVKDFLRVHGHEHNGNRSRIGLLVCVWSFC